MRGELLVTGCYRSGTTLVEKLLHAHPAICVASQPFPVFYAWIKAAFDRSIGIKRRYPLHHRFGETEYTDEAFTQFLDTHLLTRKDLDEAFDSLASYAEGLWTPEILQARDTIEPGTFGSVYEQLLEVIEDLFPGQDAGLIGSKEILVEEYVPWMLRRGVRVVLVVRDPRDMITSLNFNVRENLTGENRPVLFSIRNWRKSVATVLAFKDNPGFLWTRYEDLVHSPDEQLDRIAQFLEVSEFPNDIASAPLRNQDGRPWSGNSSFETQQGLSKASVGRYRSILPNPVRAYIESLAAPEMRALDYGAPEFEPDVVRKYRDPFDHIHEKFPLGYSCDPQRVDQELNRWEFLNGEASISVEEMNRWFIYPEAYQTLRSAISADSA